MSWLSRKALFRLHGWLGVHLGLLLFAVCASGTVAVFGPEIDWLLDARRRVSPPSAGAETASWQTLAESVRREHPHATLLSVHAPEGPRTAASAYVAYAPGDVRRVLLDPYTGAVRGQASLVDAKSFFRIFHKQLYIVPGEYWPHGTLIVGAFGVVLLLSTITALLFYERWWRSLVRLRLRRGRRVFWSDLHRMLGVWSLLVALVLAITGIWYFVEKIGHRTELLFEDRSPALDTAALPSDAASFEPAGLDRSVALARAAFPELRVRSVRPVVRLGDPVVVRGQSDAWLVRDRANEVWVDPYAREVVDVRRADRLGAFERWVETADPLHFGTFAGWTSRILWFISGLLLSAGILVGTYIWWLRVRATEPAPRAGPRRGAIAATALSTALLILAAVSAYRFIDRQLDGPNAPVRAEKLAPLVVGPWTVEVSRRVEESGEASVFVVRFPRGRHANCRDATLEYLASEREPESRAGRIFADRVLFEAPAGVRAATDGEIRLTLTAGDGSTHTADLGFWPRFASVEGDEGEVASRWTDAGIIAAAPPFPRTVGAVIAAFVLLLAAPTILWAMFVR